MPPTDIVVPPSDVPVRLIMVTGENNNKYYNMTPDPSGATFSVEWGRVGVTKTVTVYPISKWASQYKSKRNKGYKDVTALVKVTESKTNTTKSGHAKIADPIVNSLFDRLLGFARFSVKENYTISSEAVTPAQVAEAQSFVNAITLMVKVGVTPDQVNKLLLELYSVIPRRMSNVKDHLLRKTVTTDNELQLLRNIVDTEQKTLDVMSGQVSIKGLDTPKSDGMQQTILEALGIVVECGDAKDAARVRKFMGTDSHEFKGVYRVIHTNSRDLFTKQVQDAKNKTCELFWHGSRNENWISILGTGLKIRPSNAILTGAMFGNGIYFADKYRKSAGYTSLTGSYWARGSARTAFLALMDVHVGKQYEIARHQHDCYLFSRPYLAKKGGYDSVFAKGGYDLRNNEYIVYDVSQSTINYLVEVGH